MSKALIFLLITFQVFIVKAQNTKCFIQLVDNIYGEKIGAYPISDEEAKTKKHYKFSYNNKGQLESIVLSDSAYFYKFFNENNYTDVIELNDFKMFDFNLNQIIDSIVVNGRVLRNSYRFYKNGNEVTEKVALSIIFKIEPFYYENIEKYSSIEKDIIRKDIINIETNQKLDIYYLIKKINNNNYHYYKYSLTNEMLSYNYFSDDRPNYSSVFYNDYFQPLKEFTFDINGNEIKEEYCLHYNYDQNGYINEEINNIDKKDSSLIFRQTYSGNLYKTVVRTKIINDNNGNWLEKSFFDYQNNSVNNSEKSYLCARIVRKLNSLGSEESITYYLEDGTLGRYDVLDEEKIDLAKEIYKYDLKNNQLIEQYKIDSKGKYIDQFGYAIIRYEEVYEGMKTNTYYDTNNVFLYDISGVHHREKTKIYFSDSTVSFQSKEVFLGDVEFYALYTLENELFAYERTFKGQDGTVLIIHYVFNEKNQITKETYFNSDLYPIDIDGNHMIQFKHYDSFPKNVHETLSQYKYSNIDFYDLDYNYLYSIERYYKDTLGLIVIESITWNWLRDLYPNETNFVEIFKSNLNMYSLYNENRKNEPIIIDNVYKTTYDYSFTNTLEKSFFDLHDKAVLFQGKYAKTQLISDDKNRIIEVKFLNKKGKLIEIGTIKNHKYSFIKVIYNDNEELVELQLYNSKNQSCDSDYFLKDFMVSKMTTSTNNFDIIKLFPFELKNCKFYDIKGNQIEISQIQNN